MRKNAAVQTHSTNGGSLTLSDLAWPSGWLDTEGNIRWANPAMETLLSTTGITADKFFDFLDTDGGSRLRMAIARLLASGEATQTELRIRLLEQRLAADRAAARMHGLVAGEL